MSLSGVVNGFRAQKSRVPLFFLVKALLQSLQLLAGVPAKQYKDFFNSHAVSKPVLLGVTDNFVTRKF